ncbi:MAG: YbaB/EbfC family nucleoid-associated protein [Candidatus Levybacteria bacterium]|jgi:DNA-binding protein YbaB|nr:YbaB/EbfC family nucleoid-associated protein [Candidatus Levybacteria bacterium]
MANPFGQLGELKKMRDQAMQMQRQLAAEEITIEKKGILVVITGDQKLQEIRTNGKSDKDIVEAVNEAIKKSQEVAAKKLQSMSGGLSGLLGGMK